MIRASSRFFPLLYLLLLVRPGASQPLPDRFPLRGMAVDSAGKPLAGALITLRRQDEGGSYVFWGAETASDERGIFEFELAEVGRYYLSAEAKGFAPISNQTVGWKSGDKPLQVRFERLVTLPLQIFAPKAPMEAVASPLANALVWVRLRGDGSAGQSTRRALTDGEGHINLPGLLPATYSLYVATPHGFATLNGVKLRDETAPQKTALRVGLQAGGALALSVMQKSEAPGESASQARRFLGGAFLNLTALDAAESTRLLGERADPGENFALLAASGDFAALTSRDGDGTLEVANLPPGKYLARLRLPFYSLSDAHVITIQAGQTASAAFEATPTDTPQAALTLNLRRNTGTTQGRKNGDSTKNEGVANTPLPAAPVAGVEFSLRFLPIDQKGVLVSDEPPGAVVFWPGGTPARRAVSDANGQITIFPLRVGRYRVFVAQRAALGEENRDNAAESVSLDIDVPLGGATTLVEIPVAAAAFDSSLQ